MIAVNVAAAKALQNSTAMYTISYLSWLKLTAEYGSCSQFKYESCSQFVNYHVSHCFGSNIIYVFIYGQVSLITEHGTFS